MVDTDTGQGDRLIIGLPNTNPIRWGVTPIDSEYPTGTTVVGQWQWSQRWQGWFGPAYQVSWSAGDNVGVPVGPWPGLGSAQIQCSTVFGGTPWDSYPRYRLPDGPPSYDLGGVAVAATSTASGVIFIVQTATGSPTTSATPPPIDINVLDYLGDTVLLNATAVVPYALDPGDGDDGDFYIDWSERNLYQRGLDNPGLWSLYGNIADNPRQTSGSDSTDAGIPVFRGAGGPNSGADPIGDADLLNLAADTGIGSSPIGFRVRPNGTTILMGDEPDPSVLADGQMAFWLDPTPGASAVRFKAKDSAGTVVTGNLPLT